MRELERCLVVALGAARLWLVLPVLVDVLAWVEVTPGRPNARPAAVRMLAAVADAATDLTRVRPRARAASSRLLSVMA